LHWSTTSSARIAQGKDTAKVLSLILRSKWLKVVVLSYPTDQFWAPEQQSVMPGGETFMVDITLLVGAAFIQVVGVNQQSLTGWSPPYHHARAHIFDTPSIFLFH